MAKGEPKNWKHHVLKTDTSTYVEAVARAKVRRCSLTLG
jgi:hypothetical protein